MTNTLVKKFTGNDEWYTPKIYIEKARNTLGSIDLDPASNYEAQETVQATQYYSKTNNGLVQDWKGKVWMNPPYGRGLITPFLNKFIFEWDKENITEAIILTNNNTDTKWFCNLSNRANSICFTTGRIRFYSGETLSSPTNGQTFFYFGKNQTAFIKEFDDVGLIFGGQLNVT